jgi:lipopolysaccharide/colanic/teichoic acid biosynthesis glycosyltransferase
MANQIRRINEFFIAANEKLALGGRFICRVETNSERKRRAYISHSGIIADVYYFLDFLFHRVMSKIWGLKKVYFFVTKGRRRVLSRAEILGRLVSCGFDIVEETEIDNVLHFVGKKNDKGIHTEPASYGPVFKMNRVGKDGKIIGVYKMRTMHPYSEFLQDYIYQLNSLQDGGKFANDFRISTLGRIFRRFWIDELPMILNWLKGEMKLIGVRPLSRQYLGLYSDELQELRKQVKPGLMPPYYADMPSNLEEIQASEMRYLECYMKSPWTTDFKYFWMSLYNIVVKRARSK